MSTVCLGQKGVREGMQEQGSDGEDQAGLSQGSADGFQRIAIRCRRVWLVLDLVFRCGWIRHWVIQRRRGLRGTRRNAGEVDGGLEIEAIFLSW
jgi:hypothetical protein